jgi:hypothetical protein
MVLPVSRRFVGNPSAGVNKICRDLDTRVLSVHLQRHVKCPSHLHAADIGATQNQESGSVLLQLFRICGCACAL